MQLNLTQRDLGLIRRALEAAARSAEGRPTRDAPSAAGEYAAVLRALDKHRRFSMARKPSAPGGKP